MMRMMVLTRSIPKTMGSPMGAKERHRTRATGLFVKHMNLPKIYPSSSPNIKAGIIFRSNVKELQEGRGGAYDITWGGGIIFGGLYILRGLLAKENSVSRKGPGLGHMRDTQEANICSRYENPGSGVREGV